MLGCFVKDFFGEYEPGPGIESLFPLYDLGEVPILKFGPDKLVGVE